MPNNYHITPLTPAQIAVNHQSEAYFYYARARASQELGFKESAIYFQRAAAFEVVLARQQMGISKVTFHA